jgi:hypothetical protein
MFRGMFDDLWKVVLPIGAVIVTALLGLGIGIGYLIWG